jgi:arylsulfatase A-like enzyme
MAEHLRMTDDGRPFFAHVHVVEPHDPYTAPEEYEVGRDELEPVRWDFASVEDCSDLRRNFRDLDPEELALAQAHARIVYEAEVRYLDDQLAVGLQVWRERGLLDDTLVVFWSDHGEQLWEHGEYNHAYDLHYGENDALFALWADNLEPGVWDGPVSLQDLAPTVLQVAGLDVPSAMTGYPLGEAPEDRLRRAITLDRAGQSALRREELKLLFRWPSGERLLFDRVADPLETTNIFDADDPRHAALWTEMVPYVQGAEALVPGVDVNWANVNGSAP